MDHGDFVVVKNIEQIKFTGKNLTKKILSTYWSSWWNKRNYSSKT